MKVLIIDDELEARKGLEKLIMRFSAGVSEIEQADSIDQAVDRLSKSAYNIVFLDIQMPGGNGFTLFEKINNPQFSVIFTTAHAEHAIKAFRAGAIDYLLKPIDPDSLAKAINKASIYQKNLAVDNKQELKTKIGVPMSDGVHFIAIDQIIRLESSGNYTSLFMINDKKELITKPIKEFQIALEQHGFLRVHNSHMANMRFVKAYRKGIQPYLLMEDEAQVPISRSRKDKLKTELADIFGIV
jgi:two-component system LytT family response regulator